MPLLVTPRARALQPFMAMEVMERALALEGLREAPPASPVARSALSSGSGAGPPAGAGDPRPHRAE